MDGTEGSVETTDGASEADSNGEGGPPLGAGHGVVVLELRRGDSQVDDPFVGTTRVEVTLLYRDCLIGFYEAREIVNFDALRAVPAWLDRALARPAVQRGLAIPARG